MDDYSTIADLCEDYVALHTRNFDEYQAGYPISEERKFWRERFESRLAAHDRVVAAQAWDEGKDAGAIWGLNPWNATPPNPYRTEESN